MNLANVDCIATLYGCPTNPESREVVPGIFVIDLMSAPSGLGEGSLASFHIVEMGASHDEALARYRRRLVLEAALDRGSLEARVTVTRDFTRAGEAVLAAFPVELASP